MRIINVGLWLAVALLATADVAETQMTRGRIIGTVRDSSGGVVAGAAVSTTNTATNAIRTTQTDSRGDFNIEALEPGIYDVVVELAGFGRVRSQSVVVRTATATSLDVVLQPAGVAAEVTVTAARTQLPLNRVSPTIATTIDARTVIELPLAQGRDINNLVLTVPNASSTTGQGIYAINGQRPKNNNYMVDGSDNNDVTVTTATSQIVPEAVAEFQVQTNPYSVEFGRNSGGQINVITRSGTNSFRGAAWEYWTGSRFYSLDNLEKASSLTEPPTFNRHQVGATVGGPAMRDKLFFFGLYQADLQRTAARPGTTVRIPTQAGYGALQSVPLGAGQATASRQGVLQKIAFLQDVYAQNPSFRNLSTTSVNGVPIETGQTNLTIVDPSTYHSVLGRADYRLSNLDNLTVRYSLNNRKDENVISNVQFGSLFAGNQTLIDTNLAASNTHVFSSRMLNELRFSLVRRNLDFPENDPASPTAAITGLFQIGGDAGFPQSRVTNAYQFSDRVTWTLPRHSLTFGADLRYNKIENEAGINLKGTFTFNSLQDYMNNSAFRLQQALQTAGFDATQWQTFWFVQDDFRVRPDLALNLGLRYELSDVPLGMLGATDPQSLSALVPGPAKTDRNNWAPRVGFAWSPHSGNRFLGNGATVVRGGFGVGYDVIFYNLLVVNSTNFPRVVTADLNNVEHAYPNLLAPTASPLFDPLAAYANSPETLENPESRFYSLSWQRQIGETSLVEVGYTGSRSYKGINQIQVNPAILTPAQAALVASTRNAGAIPGVQARRLFPQFGPRTIVPGYLGPGNNDVESRSTYNALFVSAVRRLARGLQFHTSYTFSRWMSNNDAAFSDGGTDGSHQRPQSMFDYEAEWARSNFDRPHRFAASYIWEIPGPRSGVLGAWLGGWQISGVTSKQSGRPFTIFTGVDSSGDANTASDRPNLNPSGSFVWDDAHRNFVNNGYYVVPLGTNGLPLANSLGNGNAPRNTERYAPAGLTDFSLMKRVQTGGRQVTFRVDAFNAFNQDDYGGARGTPIAAAATFNNMNSPSFGQNGLNWGRRSFQFSAKFSF
jgi:Carboxypeptidase regulatory-like domain